MRCGLRLYQMGTWLMAPLAPFLLKARMKKGKEDKTRLRERLGYALHARPEGMLVWMHGASIGEALALLSLQKALAQHRPDLHWLLTTGTVTSARLLAERMPPQTIHQFIPLDTPSSVRRFLKHWHPDAGIFLESELWPNLLFTAHKTGLPLALVNARMNASSLKRWQRAPHFLQELLGAFRLILADDPATAEGLQSLLGRPVQALGSLKAGQGYDVTHPAHVRAFRDQLGSRPVWCAASTHEGEEELILQAHHKILQTQPETLLFLAPRHPERCDSVEHMIKTQGFSLVRRTTQQPVTPEIKVCLIDTLGELDLFYRLASVAFIGGSLFSSYKGHNPYEAARAGSALITGVYTESFEEAYKTLENANAVRRVMGSDDLATTVENLLRDEKMRDDQVRAAREPAHLAEGAFRQVVEACLSFLPEASCDASLSEVFHAPS